MSDLHSIRNQTWALEKVGRGVSFEIQATLPVVVVRGAQAYKDGINMTFEEIDQMKAFADMARGKIAAMGNLWEDPLDIAPAQEGEG